MKQLIVELGERSYPIMIGAGVLNQAAELLSKHLPGKQVMVVSNPNVAEQYGYLKPLLSQLVGKEVSYHLFPDGEEYKTQQQIDQLYAQLLQNKHSRNTSLIALGGGVVGDMTGYASACYQRGVNFIQVPTTLLSQVDSSVGGKTGINHPLGKNMIGAFKQPGLVLIDTQVLHSLPARELSAGLAEVVKYGLIYDAEFFAWLEQQAEALMAMDDQALAYAIERCCAIKAEVVAQDETEQGIRAWLNLGHTFGHAIEASMGYGTWLHGEAVAAGTVMALDLSVRLGMLPSEALERTKLLLQRMKLPIAGPAELSAEQYLPKMAVDKKNVDGNIRLVLLEQLGRACLRSAVDNELLLQVIRDNTGA